MVSVLTDEVKAPPVEPVAEGLPPDMIPGIRVDVQLYVAGVNDGMANIFHVSYAIKQGGGGLNAEALAKIGAVLKEMAEARMGQPVRPMTDQEIQEYDQILEAQQEALERRAQKGHSDA